MAIFGTYSVIILFLFTSGCRTDSSFVQDADLDFRNIDRLRTDLRRGYDRNARPVKHHKTQVNINVAMASVWLANMDASIGAVTLSGAMFLQWKDEHLSWDEAKYGGIHETSFSSYEIWTPDIINWNSIKNEPVIRNDMERCNIMVTSDGTALWAPAFKTIVDCNMRLDEYPSDSQTCTLVYGLWVSNMSEVKLNAGLTHIKSVEFPVSSYIVEMNEWSVLEHELTASNVTEMDGVTYSCVRLRMQIKRSSSMLTFVTRVPYYLAAMIQLSIFFTTTANSNDRVCLTLVALLVLYGEKLLVDCVLLPGVSGITVPFLVRCLELNAFVIASNLIIVQAVHKVISMGSLPNPIETRISQLISLISKYSLTQVLCCRVFRDNLDFDVTSNVSEGRVNSLTTGIHDLTDEPETEADDESIIGMTSAVAPTHPFKSAKAVLLVIDRCLLLQYLIFLTVFRV